MCVVFVRVVVDLVLFVVVGCCIRLFAVVVRLIWFVMVLWFFRLCTVVCVCVVVLLLFGVLFAVGCSCCSVIVSFVMSVRFVFCVVSSGACCLVFVLCSCMVCWVVLTFEYEWFVCLAHC